MSEQKYDFGDEPTIERFDDIPTQVIREDAERCMWPSCKGTDCKGCRLGRSMTEHVSALIRALGEAQAERDAALERVAKLEKRVVELVGLHGSGDK